MENENAKQQEIQEENVNLSWIDEEENRLGAETDRELIPALQLEPDKLTAFQVDFSKPFVPWVNKENGVVMAIIPVLYNLEKMNFWLNKNNPLYRQILQSGKNGQTTFNILRTGEGLKTRYNVVKD